MAGYFFAKTSSMFYPNVEAYFARWICEKRVFKFLRKLQEQVSHPAGEVAGQVRISIEGQDNSYALHDLRIRAASI